MTKKITETIVLLFLIGLVVAAGNTVGYPINLQDSLLGMAILCAITAVGYLASQIKYLNKLPPIFWVSVIAACAATILPWSEFILIATKKIQFLAICTPILAYAGLAVGKDLGMFKKMSWKIIPVALAVFTGTFMFAAILAQFTLQWEGVIP